MWHLKLFEQFEDPFGEETLSSGPGDIHNLFFGENGPHFNCGDRVICGNWYLPGYMSIDPPIIGTVVDYNEYLNDSYLICFDTPLKRGHLLHNKNIYLRDKYNIPFNHSAWIQNHNLKKL